MSYRNSSLKQDILLKHYVDEPEGARPGFNWGEALDEGEPLGSRGAVRLSTPQGERALGGGARFIQNIKLQHSTSPVYTKSLKKI